MAKVQWERTLTMTEVEEEVLVTMCKYFIENSRIDRETENAFDTLVEKVCAVSYTHLTLPTILRV